VVRDNNGEIMAVKARWHEHVPDVLTYGSTGSKGWLLLALALDYRRMTLEVDNISLVNLLKSPNGCRSPIAGSWYVLTLKNVSTWNMGITNKFLTFMEVLEINWCDK
jgi:hypothetical protein